LSDGFGPTGRDLLCNAPIFGDVTQRIAQRILSPDLNERVVREVASNCKQPGKVLEALQVLAADVDLTETCGLVAKITKVKAWVKEALARFKTGGWVSPTLRIVNHLSRWCGMSRYRRLYIPGGTYFFTVTLADRSATTLVDEIDLLRSVYAATVKEHPVTCDAMVVLPDHIHAVWTLPKGDADFSVRWKKIKGRFSRHCKAHGNPSPSKAARGEKGIWQRRFWEHAIRDESDLQRHVAYCWWNPVKHGLVDAPEAWPYSRFRRVGATHAL